MRQRRANLSPFNYRGGAILDGGELLGSATDESGCIQRLRVLANQELDNGCVALASHTVSSIMNGRLSITIDEGQQAPLP